MIKNAIPTIIVAFVVIAALSIFAYLIFKAMPSPVKNLDAVEVRQYEGENLSSVNDFRENSIKGPQFIDKASYRLKIKGLTGGEKSFSYEDVINTHQAYKKVVTLNCIEGWSVKILWEGILMRELIDASEIPAGAKTVIFRAYDGYSTSFPVDFIMKNDRLLAYKMNGATLPPERGFPFQLVAEDKYGYKWIKWITEIEFSSDVDYKGYWESRGYDNDGSLRK